MTCDHSYSGGYCIHCLKKQPIYRNGVEVGLSDLSGVKIAPQARFEHRKRINSEAQYEVDRLMQFFKEDVYKKGNFAKYARAYKVLGKQRITSFISYCKERNIYSPAYFWGFYKNAYRELDLTKEKK